MLSATGALFNSVSLQLKLLEHLYNDALDSPASRIIIETSMRDHHHTDRRYANAPVKLSAPLLTVTEAPPATAILSTTQPMATQPPPLPTLAAAAASSHGPGCCCQGRLTEAVCIKIRQQPALQAGLQQQLNHTAVSGTQPGQQPGQTVAAGTVCPACAVLAQQAAGADGTVTAEAIRCAGCQQEMHASAVAVVAAPVQLTRYDVRKVCVIE